MQKTHYIHEIWKKMADIKNYILINIPEVSI
jgi:hypothetical protein